MSLRPAEPATLAVGFVKLLKFAGAFGVKTENHETALDIYREHLSSLPADLFEAAITRIIGSWIWRTGLPTPGDIRALVVDDMARRRLAMVRLTMLERQAAREPVTKPLSPEDRAKIRELIEGAGRARVVRPPAEAVTAPTPGEIAELMQACGVSADEVLSARSPGR